MSSDRKINYTLRPSKSIERKMMLEVFKEICIPSKAEKYQYIGFGASFFYDFKMIHRELNISKMVSIEGNSSAQNVKRCKFNLPLNCISVKPGMSYQILPKLNWKKKSIVWLDYDKCMQNYMFDDLETCCVHAQTGGFLVVSLRREFDQRNKIEFEEEFTDKVPANITAEDLEPKMCHITIREMFLNKIHETLLNKYSADKEDNRLVFKQLFNFTYQDDAEMYTLGGMFIFKKEEEKFNEFKFHSYNFVTSSEVPINISLPIITNKEYHEMTRYLPSSEVEFVEKEEIDFIPKVHKVNYYNTYRFYPAYTEIREL